MAKRVAVLHGGWSNEREVSLVSGRSVAEALEGRGHAVTLIDVQRDLRALAAALDAARPDAVYNALHGHGGEDGTVQGVLEMMSLPYTHSGVMASAIAMDKPMTKRLLSTVGIRSPQGLERSREELLGGGHPMALPYVVKPAADGSTCGVTLVRQGHNGPVVADTVKPGERLLVEEFIRGRELTVGVMGDRALGVTEIRYSSEIFDYTAKYTSGHAEHVIPAPVPAPIAEEAKRVALLAHTTLGCRGVSRSDFRWDDAKPGLEGLYFLEINTQPGFTPLSLVPEQARHADIEFGELCEWILGEAQCSA
ncbi:MAG TPA: D-alanine--D-alanine ligase [Alphaproteobacteria bacterium]|nr:D-alanine--D-alanine ligase [Alphaproteobacteria bacterium]